MYIKRYYFDEIDINDFNFIQQANMLNIKEEKIDFNLPITHSDIVIERLDESSYYNLSSLNYNLLSELLSKNTKQYKDILTKYLNTIFKLENKYKFLYSYYNIASKKFDKLLKLIVDSKMDIINGLIELDDCSYRDDFIFLILNKSELSKLIIEDTNYEKLINIIKNSAIGIKKEVSSIFNANIVELSVKGLKYDSINGIKSEELLNKIVENNIYDINKENLDLILKRKYKYSNKSVKKSPIKLIFDINDEYILSDKNKIINIYCGNGSNLYTDDQETIKKVLSDPLISNISKKCFIYSEETKIDDISYITDLDLLNKIVVNGSLVCSWNNIYYYYSMPESSKETLSNYILSDTDNVLSNKNIDDIIRQDLSFLKYVLTINNISNDLFDILFDMYTDKYDLLEASTTRVLTVDEHKLDKLLSIQDYNHKEDVQKYKISIINNNFNIINETNVSDKLNKIGHDYSWMLINNKKPEFSNNTEIKNLIANLNTILKYNIEYYESNERIFIKGSRNKKKGYCSNRQLSSVR